MNSSPLVRELMDIAMLPICSRETRTKLITRISSGKLTRQENKHSHFCVYFVPFKEIDGEFHILIGLHKKANLYLAPGGHLDRNHEGRDERCIEALKREFPEEFQVSLPPDFSPNPFWITVTQIKKGECKVHFDIWYAINSTEMVLGENDEFDHMMWVKFKDLPRYISDLSSLEALSVLESNVHSFA